MPFGFCRIAESEPPGRGNQIFHATNLHQSRRSPQVAVLGYLCSMSIRVRFAPSPTGGLHLGGVRTVLFNYLFAKHHGGKFILRIEDTDQKRYVPGAEEYIYECLKWAGLEPDESPLHGGDYGPYRQSERKSIYRGYAEQLVKDGHAYYAFDTPAELEKMRTEYRSEENPNPQYDHRIRKKMRNSISLTDAEVQSLLQSNTPYVIRIKMPENEVLQCDDLIRGEIRFETGLVDDKVLLKADGMPTYHLAVVVDDYLMKITHAFRGEEWLPSAPVHILLWKYLFGWEAMPKWAHLPLILGPNGKLSKRDGAKYGFPVFAMNWTDPQSGELTEGFREKGFLPSAFVNMLAMLGWNDGTEQELFTMEELIEKFSIERIQNGGARFDYEKAKWFNQEWIKRQPDEMLADQLTNMLAQKNLNASPAYVLRVVQLVKERCVLLNDLWEQSRFFFEAPVQIDLAAISSKWNADKHDFFQAWIKRIGSLDDWYPGALEENFKAVAAEKNIKPGELQLPLRIMLVGGKFGPAVFEITGLIGASETIGRIESALGKLASA